MHMVHQAYLSEVNRVHGYDSSLVFGQSRTENPAPSGRAPGSPTDIPNHERAFGLPVMDSSDTLSRGLEDSGMGTAAWPHRQGRHSLIHRIVVTIRVSRSSGTGKNFGDEYQNVTQNDSHS